jgi:uncharacterized protein (DUF433 family)
MPESTDGKPATAGPVEPGRRPRRWGPRLVFAVNRTPTETPGAAAALPPASASTASPAGDRRIRGWSIATIVLVAVVGTAISSWHAYELVRSGGEPAPVAAGYPLLIDGVIFMASMVILMYSRRGMRAPLLAWVALIFGALVTLAVNVAQGWDGGMLSRLVSAIPPLAVIGSYELLMKQIRLAAVDAAAAAARRVASHLPPAEEPVAEQAAAEQPVARTLAEAVLAARACGESIRGLARAFEIPRSRVEAIIREAEADGDEAADGAADAEVDAVLEALLDSRPLSALNGSAAPDSRLVRSDLGGGV